MNNKLIPLAASALLAGCATSGSVGGPAVDPLLARGETPAWQLTVTPARIVFSGPGGAPAVDEANPTGTVPKNGRLQGQRILIDSRTQACALTSTTTTQTVRVTVDGRTYEGCGGEQSQGLSLGAGSWTVLSVNGRPTPLDRPFTASFERGRLSMVLGCNRLNAPFALADRVLSVGTIAKTRMACADPSFEEAGEKALALPFVVEAIGSEQVVLRNAVGTLNLARTRT
ncbi:META domain-containing protein [Sphingomonas kaistensis]|uniref:META domain-containing protein n=1 Tax=Sphingomonas kaistensis TaxID=298708 RepID=A0ABZ2FZ32_9SPHN